MKKNLCLFFLLASVLLITNNRIIAQEGIRYIGKMPEVKLYSSGKIEQYVVKAQNKMKAGEEPTAHFEVTYHNFSDDAKTAFAKAVENWSYLVRSSVTIKIDATWEALGTGVLGSASANSFRRGFKNAPRNLTWYPIAIANKLAGYDLEPDNHDISARFSSSINWYLGLDGATPTTKYDFISTVMHEIGHGLGFIGSANVEGTNGSWGSGTIYPFIFDRFVFNGNDELLIDTLTFTNPSTDLKTQYTSEDVYFHSELSDVAAPDNHAKLYTPSSWNDGSSYSHLDEIYNSSDDAMMTYSAGTGEVTHHPGSITLGMFAEMGWISVLFKHQKINDMESMTAPITVETEIFSDSSLIDASVYLHYSTDNFITDNEVIMTTSNDTLFTASIPIQATDTVKYYFQATSSLNRTYYYPVQGTLPVVSIDTTLYFAIGADNIAPELEHTPKKSIFNFDEELQVNIGANDNVGIDSVYIEYKFNEGALTTQKCDSIGFSEFENSYKYTTTINVSGLNDGDTVYYGIIAIDLASTPNQTIQPETDFFKVAILDLGEATQDLTINFDDDSHKALFYAQGLTIEQPSGFSSKAIHCPHPYEEGDPYPTDEISYSIMLKTPIIIKEEDAFIRFDEIVIVEPGKAGVSFGDDDFWDYVVVEGSVDSGKTWYPFEDGYDSRVSTTFTNAFNNESNGTESMYLSHMINLLGNENIIGNQKTLIRFLLWSDQLSAGWGWAIDNLEIQGQVTSVETANLLLESFKVYPSPSDGHFKIELSSKKQINEYSISVYNATGEVILKESKNAISNSINHNVDITGKPSGIYFLKISYGNQLISKKIIKR